MIREIEFFYNHELSGNTTEVLCASRPFCKTGELDGHKCDLVASCLWLKPSATSVEIAEVFRVLGMDEPVRSTRIGRKNQHGEYCVKLYIDGVHQEFSNYYTDDLLDAQATAKHMRGES